MHHAVKAASVAAAASTRFSISCDGNIIQDLDFASDCTALTKLKFIDRNGCKTLNALKGSSSLEFLSFYRDEGGDISEDNDTDSYCYPCDMSDPLDLNILRALQRLNTMEISFAAVKNMDALASVSSELRDLTFAYTKVKDIGHLSSLTKLTSFSCIGNKVEDLTPLRSCTALVKLDLQWCKSLGDLSPLACLGNLEDLGLESTNISDLKVFATGFAPLKNLVVEDTLAESITTMPVSRHNNKLRLLRAGKWSSSTN
eukprot:gene3339-13367_t